MILSNILFTILLLMLARTESTQLCSKGMSPVNLLIPPLCYEGTQGSLKHTGILDSNTLTVLMALLALASLITQ